MNQEGETGLPAPAYIAVTQEDARRGWSERRREGAGDREERGEREGGKQDKQRRLGEKEEAKTERG